MVLIRSLNILFFVIFFISLPVYGLTISPAEELKIRIEARRDEIEEIEREISKLDGELLVISEKSDTLKNKVSLLDKERARLDALVRKTQSEINITDLKVNELGRDIGEKSLKINFGKNSLAAAVNLINRVGSITFVEIILSSRTLSQVWMEFNDLGNLQGGLIAGLSVLEEDKRDMELARAKLAQKEKEMVSLRGQLRDQKKIADFDKEKQSKLLGETKNLEANYKKMREEVEARRKAVEEELIAFESELKFSLDASSIPKFGTKTLIWPLKNIYITQKFGQTSFAKTAAVYNGKGHNGVDLRAAVGTSVYSALSGTVIGTGDTDKTCERASYGKWVLVRHNNGLSSLYAHLSLIKVDEGQIIETGELLGYSGNTGYSTGPHLHFSVFASAGVQVGFLKSKVRGCGTYRLPLAPLNSYLDPLGYL